MAKILNKILFLNSINIASNIYSMNNVNTKYTSNKKATLDKIKDQSFINKIFNCIKKVNTLKITNYNKTLQNKINIKIKDYIQISNKMEIILANPIKQDCLDKIGNSLIKNYEKSYQLIKDNSDLYNTFEKKIQNHNHIFINNYYNNNKVYGYILSGDDNLIKNINILLDEENIDIKNKKNEEIIKSQEYIKVISKNPRKNLKSLFSNINSFSYVNLLDLNLNNVETIEEMFKNCKNLKKINFNNSLTNFKNMKSIASLFAKCKNLISVDNFYFSTEKECNASHLFDSCTSLTDLKIQHFNSNNVTNMSNMFKNCNINTLFLNNNLYNIGKILTANIENLPRMIDVKNSKFEIKTDIYNNIVLYPTFNNYANIIRINTTNIIINEINEENKKKEDGMKNFKIDKYTDPEEDLLVYRCLFKVTGFFK